MRILFGGNEHGFEKITDDCNTAIGSAKAGLQTAAMIEILDF